MQLYQPEAKKGSPDDPYMINPKGARVMVPVRMVSELLTKGFILEDKDWHPAATTLAKVEESILRDVPLSRKQLLEETQRKLDTLDVWEV